MLIETNNDTNKLIQNHELGDIIEEALSKILMITEWFFHCEINGLNVAETADF